MNTYTVTLKKMDSRDTKDVSVKARNIYAAIKLAFDENPEFNMADAEVKKRKLSKLEKETLAYWTEMKSRAEAA